MAKPDIDALLNTQPPNPDADIALVKQDGRPTSFYLDWLLSQTDWFRQNVVKTDQRIDNVKAEAGEALADYKEEVNAIIGPDGALVEKVETVAARANNATANGQIYFAAVAGPVGSVAAYGIYLTAGNAYTGMMLVAKSDGTAAIMFDANYFALNDSGTLKNVFNYTGGIFTFNVPVRIGTVDILAGAVNAPVVSTVTSSREIGDTNWTSLVSATHTGASGYVALIHVDFRYVTGGSSGVISGNYRIRRSDGQILYTGDLYNFANPFVVTHTVLDTSFNDTYTYHLEVEIDTTGPTFVFTRRAVMIDLRKR